MAEISRLSATPLLAIVLLLSSACTRNVPQDSATGKDGSRKGARNIAIEDGEGRARDVITYPGGDRIDWKTFEIPDGPGGRLRLKMKIRPPRRGHTVAFVLYDKYFRPLERSTKKSKRVKSVILEHAPPGKYYLQVYAPRRRDAGEYSISLRFKEGGHADPCDSNPDDPSCSSEIPDPPKLPAIPEAECRKDDDCKDGASCISNSCKKKDPCAETSCPEGQVCRVEGAAAACVEGEVTAQCVTGRLVKYQLSSSGSVIVTVDKGKSSSVAQGWAGQVLVRGTARPLSGGSFKVTKVTQGESVGKVRLSLDQLSANRRIQICPN